MNKMLITIIAVAIGLLFFSSSVPAVTQWEKTYGGTGSDRGQCMRQTTDGGLIIAGSTDTYGAGANDVWLIKTDIDGTMLWDRTFGGSGDDLAHTVRQTKDGGYIIGGQTTSYGAGTDDVWLIKTDSEGLLQWDRTFGDTGGDVCFDVQQTSDGGYIVTGHVDSYGPSPSDVWLIKTDSDGNELWNRKFGDVEEDSGQSVLEANDGGFVIAGYTQPGGRDVSNVWLIKTDSEGLQVWNYTRLGSSSSAACVKQTSDGGYIVTGFTHDTHITDSIDVLLIKTDPDGNPQWDESFGGTADDRGNDVWELSDGGYLIAGETMSYGYGERDAWLIMVDPDGNQTWDQAFGGPNDDSAVGICELADGRRAIVGRTESSGEGGGDAWLFIIDKFWARVFEPQSGFEVRHTVDGGYMILAWPDRQMIKTDAYGFMEWETRWADPSNNCGLDIQQTEDGGYIIVGQRIIWHNYGVGEPCVLLIKTDSHGNEQWERIFDRESPDCGQSVQQTEDGGYIIAAYTYQYYPSTNRDVWLIKTDANGILEWSHMFDRSAEDAGSSVKQTSDGGYIIAGTTEPYGAGGRDIWLIKTNSNGTKQWDRTFGGSGLENAHSVCQTDDGGYFIVGWTDSYGAGLGDAWLIKTDQNGSIEWNRTYGGSENDWGRSGEQTCDGGYIITGEKGDTPGSLTENGDLWLIKIDSGGSIQWDRTYGGPEEEGGSCVEQTDDGGYIVTGFTFSYNSYGAALWLIKIDRPSTDYYRDFDVDGYGDSSDVLCLETPVYPYTAIIGGDCDDLDPDVNPGMVEVICNGKDDDCSEATPDDPNADGDPVSFCEGDCDDNDPNVYPGATEACRDGIDNNCDGLTDSDDPDCQLTTIHCLSPSNGSVLSSAPTFMWMADGGDNNRFAVDLSFDWTFSTYWSTYENLHRPIAAQSWAMPQQLWSYIPSGSYVYWRVRGADLTVTPLTIITSDEVWWFYRW